MVEQRTVNASVAGSSPACPVYGVIQMSEKLIYTHLTVGTSTSVSYEEAVLLLYNAALYYFGDGLEDTLNVYVHAILKDEAFIGTSFPLNEDGDELLVTE